MPSDYPLVSFHFQVQWGGSRIGFSEVSGLSMEVEVIEYREGSDPEHAVRKIPGIKKFSNITLKRGVIRADNEFFDWMNTHQIGTVEKRNITLALLNEVHEPSVVWKITNAFPVKLQWTPLNSSSGDILIEILEMAHEGFVVENGK